jgi:hypothetical protein
MAPRVGSYSACANIKFWFFGEEIKRVESNARPQSPLYIASQPHTSASSTRVSLITFVIISQSKLLNGIKVIEHGGAILQSWNRPTNQKICQTAKKSLRLPAAFGRGIRKSTAQQKKKN